MRSQMIDILFLGGYTVEETLRMQTFCEGRDAVANMVAERRLSSTYRSFHAKVGEKLEFEKIIPNTTRLWQKMLPRIKRLS